MVGAESARETKKTETESCDTIDAWTIQHDGSLKAVDNRRYV